MKGEHELAMVLGDRRYRVRGWKKPLNPEALKVNLLVHRPTDAEARSTSTRSTSTAPRRAPASCAQAGIELGEAEDVLKHDLGRVLLKLEEMQDAEIWRARSAEDDSAGDERGGTGRGTGAAEGARPDGAHPGRLRACGVVGEATNILVGYLACVSRLARPPVGGASSSRPARRAKAR